MIPVGSNNQWTYAVYGLDSNGHKSGEAGSRTLSLFQNWQFPVYQWDSASKSWSQTSIQANQFVGSEFDSWDNFESFSDNFIFAPYSDGAEKGLICGDIFEGTLGGRFWYVLPDHPTGLRSFKAMLLVPYRDTIKDTDIYHAFFDTAHYGVSVPAGDFQCYKLVFRYDGQDGDLRIEPDSIITVDTMYLAPGTGIVKRVIWQTRKNHYLPNNFWTVDYIQTQDFELSSYKLQ